MRLVACDTEALALGLMPGTALADARARVPDLAVFGHDPAADMALLGWLADGCERYTPACMLDPPQSLLLDITGCEHLFGDETRLARDVRARLQRHGLSCRIALGATPDSAQAKAKYAARAISDLPVEALDGGDKVHKALRRAGLRSIGDLAIRPRKPLAARFGKSVVIRLARLLEEEDPRIIPRRSLPIIHVAQNFAEPISRTNDVLATIEMLAGRAALQLQERGQGGRRFEVRLFRSDGHVALLAIDTGGPTRDAALLMRLIRERIDALADPLDPGFGYDLIALEVPLAEVLANVQVGLETRVDTDAATAALIDRLSVRLGAQRVRQFHARQSHIPERAALERAAQSDAPKADWPKSAPDEPAMRPFRLFETPQPIEVTAGFPEGEPRSFRWRRHVHRVARVEGPERISPEWWRHARGYEPGNGSLTRDYYRVEDNEGRRFWLFRRGLYDEMERPLWYLHGIFA